MLSEVNHTVDRFGKKLKALVLFGSSVYSFRGARDIDLMVIVDRLSSIDEKNAIEIEIIKTLKSAPFGKPIDVIVLDVEMFRENLEPGAIASGLIAGFTIIFDEIDIPKLLEIAAEKIAQENIVIVKHGRKINLSTLAKLYRQKRYLTSSPILKSEAFRYKES